MKLKLTVFLLMVLCVALFPNGSQEEGAQGDEKVEISFWYSAAEGDENDVVYRFHQENVELFTAANPNVSIDTFVLGGASGGKDYRAKLVTEAAAGSIPDIFMTWHGKVTQPIVDAGLLMPIEEIIESDSELARTVDRSKLAMCTYDGTLYGLPDSVDAIGLFYNKAVFRENGLTVPATFDELLEVGEKLMDEGITPVGLGLNPNNWMSTIIWQLIFMQENSLATYQQDILNGDWDFTETGYVDAMETAQRLALDGYFGEFFNSISAGEAKAKFITGDSAMLVFGTWATSSLYGELGDDLGYITLPSIDGQAPSYMIAASKGYALSKDAPQAAVDFFKFIYSPERQAKYAEMGVFISPKNVAYDSSSLPGVMNEINSKLSASEKTFVIWNDFLSESIKSELFPGIQMILSGSDPAEILANVQAAKQLSE